MLKAIGPMNEMFMAIVCGGGPFRFCIVVRVKGRSARVLPNELSAAAAVTKEFTQANKRVTSRSDPI